MCIRDSGKGVYGFNEAVTGEALGVHGFTRSDDGVAVFGEADANGGGAVGVRGLSNGFTGIGVHGQATGVSAVTVGVLGETDSPFGYGVRGRHNASGGLGYGVIGETGSGNGIGAVGIANAGEGSTRGVWGLAVSADGIGVQGQSDVPGGTGVHGLAGSQSGPSVGVLGTTASGQGVAVRGHATSTTGISTGVEGVVDSENGIAINGIATNGTGVNVAVRGEATSESGVAVWAQHNGSNGPSYAVLASSDTLDGAAIRVENTGGGSAIRATASGTNPTIISVEANNSSPGEQYGVRAEVYSTLGVGLYGSTTGNLAPGVWGESMDFDPGGLAYGVRGDTILSENYAVYANGDLVATGTKNFVQPDPNDASREIRFACLEGNESGTYFRGTARTEGGRATIAVPEDFRLVTEPEGLTVQLTAVGALALLAVESRSLDAVVVRSDRDVEFDYLVQGVRRGFADFETIGPNRSFVPSYRDIPFGTQFPAGLQRVLIENGILNEDLTPNAETAARLGWELREPSEKRRKLFEDFRAHQAARAAEVQR